MQLVDTGGYKLTRDIGTKEAELDDYVVERSLEMIDKADVVILLLEAGVITGEDEEFIIKMRPYWKKLIAAVNKTEGGKNEAEAWNYAKYGFENLIFISAEHGDRISELTDLVTERCDFSKVRLRTVRIISTERASAITSEETRITVFPSQFKNCSIYG